MGRLTILRAARWLTGRANKPDHPHLETLIEEESVKIMDGFHYARWIVPLAAAGLSLALWLPLALTIHPLFWIGFAGFLGIGGLLGYIFHRLAARISPTQILLRKRSLALGNRMVSMKSLVGMMPALSPKVAAFLDEAAAAYLAARPNRERDGAGRSSGLWAEPTLRLHRAMDDAMAQMLSLAEPETPAAQEVELSRGWAQPLLAEMKAAGQSLAEVAGRERIAAQVESSASPLAGLANARADVERLRMAESELDHEVLRAPD